MSGGWWAPGPFYPLLYFPPISCTRYIVGIARAYLNGDVQRRRSIEIPTYPWSRWKKYDAQSRWTPVQSTSLLSAGKKDDEKCGNDALSSHCSWQLYPITSDPLLPFLPFAFTDHRPKCVAVGRDIRAVRACVRQFIADYSASISHCYERITRQAPAIDAMSRIDLSQKVLVQ